VIGDYPLRLLQLWPAARAQAPLRRSGPGKTHGRDEIQRRHTTRSWSSTTIAGSSPTTVGADHRLAGGRTAITRSAGSAHQAYLFPNQGRIATGHTRRIGEQAHHHAQRRRDRLVTRWPRTERASSAPLISSMPICTQIARIVSLVMVLVCAWVATARLHGEDWPYHRRKSRARWSGMKPAFSRSFPRAGFARGVAVGDAACGGGMPGRQSPTAVSS